MSNHKAGKALSLRRGASAPLSIASRESLERVLFASERECARERPKHSLIPTCAPFLSSAMHPAHAYPPPSATVSPRPSTPPPLAAPQTRPSWPATAAAPRQTGATPAAWQNFSSVSATAYQPRTSTIGTFENFCLRMVAEIAKQAGMEAGSNNANPWGNSRVMRLLRGRGLGVCVHS